MFKTFLFQISVFSILFHVQLFAQEQQYLSLDKSYLISVFEDAGAVAVSPLQWDQDEWLGFAGFSGITLITYSQDEQIRNFFQRNRQKDLDNISKNVIDPLGTWYLAGIIGSMYLYGLAADDAEIETAALLTGKSVLITGAYTFLSKAIFQRVRPHGTNPSDPHLWEGPFGGFSHNAFPSGHTSVAFAAASTLSAYYRDKLWVGITSYTLASLVGLSRIYDDKHWASDVVAGAALGYAIGKLVYKRYAQKKLMILPYRGFDANGLRLSYRF